MIKTTFYPTHSGAEISEIDLRARVDADGNIHDLIIRFSGVGPWVECPDYWREQALRHLQVNCMWELGEAELEARRGRISDERRESHADR